MLRALALLVLLAPGDEADVWKLLDDPRAPADKLKSALGGDPARAMALLRKGRPGLSGAAGEAKDRVKDAFGGETDLWIVAPPSYDPSIRVTCKGRKLFDGRVKPSVDAVAESWRSREDGELLYRASVTVAVP